MNSKMIGTVGTLIIVGSVMYVGISWGVLPEPEWSENGNDSIQDVDTRDTEAIDNTDEEPENTASEDQETRTQETTETGRTDCEVRQREVSPIETDELEEVYSQSGPPLDERKAESTLHDTFNDLRTTYGNNTQPLVCDTKLRDIAQRHSEVMAEFGFLGEEVPDEATPDGVNISANPEYRDTSARYAGVCENPTELYGRWLYQRNRLSNWDGPSLDQRAKTIEDYDEFSLDVRGVWFNEKDRLDVVKNENITRQGVGVYINRSTRVVYVTHAVC
jgi:hypothetical protein